MILRQIFCLLLDSAKREGLARCSTFGGAKKDGENYYKAEALVKSWGSLLYPRVPCGSRSYLFSGSLADLENALLNYALDTVKETGVFQVMSVPDILPLSTTRSCGLIQVPGDHTLQYLVPNYPDHCLSGTAEMGIAHNLRSQIFEERELPKFYVAKSRCFRPEIAVNSHETGIYRVHEFTKIEMFAVCAEAESEDVLLKLLGIQKQIFGGLDLCCRSLEMPAEDLNPAATRKYDVEVWMPGRQMWGEVSSASNCTDYQSQRLGIRYNTNGGETKFVHTCNGTALSSARALIALLETHQNPAKKGFSPPDVIKQRLSSKRIPAIRMQNGSPFVYKF